MSTEFPFDIPYQPKRRVKTGLVVLSATALFTTMLLSGPAQGSGLYLSGGLGVNLASDSDVTGTGISTNIEFDPGPVAMVALGYSFDNNFRTELELAGRWNDAETVGGASGSGDTTTTSGMVNVVLDLDVDSDFTPYLGAGLGAANVENSGIATISNSTISDDDTVFAYQAIAGVSYDLGNMISVTADYRYFTTDDVSLTTASNVSVEQEYASHSFLIGLRLDFDTTGDTMPEVSSSEEQAPEVSQIAETPTPDADTEMVADSADASDESEMVQTAAAPATPEATPEFPHAYRILFDWDKKALNPLALNTIAAIAMNATEGEIIRIKATGHADRSGTEAYNENLSRLRAEEVMVKLVELGIPKDHIIIEWRGEKDPAVITADGVRNQDNRRVEILFLVN